VQQVLKLSLSATGGKAISLPYRTEMSESIFDLIPTSGGPVITLKDGTKKDFGSLKGSGDLLLLYCSAHWCPPCRGFTPLLAERYGELKASGKSFEIVFISSDRSAAEAEEYYQEQPWAILDYSHRDTKQLIAEAYGVRGIPTLIILDGLTGALISTEGRELFMSVEFDEIKTIAEEKAKADALRAAKLTDARENPKPPAALFPEGAVVDQEGNAADISGKSVVGLYFSAHWCGPCRKFTPILAERYTQLVEKEGKSFEIVFVSADRSEAEALEYFSEQPWKFLKFEEEETNTFLSELFNIEGIPSLVLLDAAGNVIDLDGTESIISTPFDDLKAPAAGSVFNLPA